MAFAALASAVPSILSAIQGPQRTTPMIMPTLTPAQQSLFAKMLRSSSGLSGLQGNTLGYMIQGGTANDYSPAALNTYYQYSLRTPALQDLYSRTLPGIGNQLASQYFSSRRVNAQNEAELGTRANLQQQYSQLALENELARKQAQEESRMGGLSLLGQMQQQAMSAKPFEIVYKPKYGEAMIPGLINKLGMGNSGW